MKFMRRKSLFLSRRILARQNSEEQNEIVQSGKRHSAVTVALATSWWYALLTKGAEHFKHAGSP